MKTIDKILKRRGFTEKQLLDYEMEWIANWMWGKWWIQFTDIARKLPAFESDKEQKLLYNVDLISDIHDYKYFIWWSYIDFIKANYDLSVDLFTLLHWTNIIARIFVFLLVFISTSLFGYKYFTKWKR